MAHDVFISYSSSDKAVADAMCAKLESNKIRCWIAPRDVLPGKIYAEALMEGLNEGRLMILVFSENSNTSPQVLREVERAVHRGIPIIPFRIENVLPSKAMEYFVSSSHWLDALTPPLEMHLQRLADTVQVLLSDGNTSLADKMPPSFTTPAIKTKSRIKALPLFIVVGSVVCILAIVGVIFLTGGFGRGTPVPNQAPPATKPPATSLSGPKAKGILYEDDFDDPYSGWKKYSDETEDSNYENGEYSLTVKKWNWVRWVENRNAGRFADMVIDIDARLVSGSFQSGYGIVFRAQKDESYYLFLVSGQGGFRIEKRDGGVFYVLQKYTISPFINQGNTANHLKVVCKGTKMDLECNDQLLASITDDSFSEGCVGVAVDTVEPNATAHFDNLKISSVN